jgi:predicted regulator of Ras-like GTPase activity (Roadblock/LC7/MglB family)
MKENTRQPASSDRVLTQKEYTHVSECLMQLAQKLKIRGLFLVTSSGQIVTKRVMETWKSDATLFSTLSAGTFAAAKEMAKMLGEEKNFKMVLHEGEHLNVFVSTITEYYFIIVVFEKNVALGMVRILTKRTIEQLRSFLKTNNENTNLDGLFDPQFQNRLGEELDRSFREWN